MAANYHPTGLRQLTPQQRLDALATVLAKGAGPVLALRITAAVATGGVAAHWERNWAREWGRRFERG